MGQIQDVPEWFKFSWDSITITSITYPKNCIVNGLVELVNLIESKRACSRWVGVDFTDRIPAFKKKVGECYPIVPGVVNVGVTSFCK